MLWLRLPVGNIYVYGDVEPRFGPHALLESLSSEYEGLVDDCDEKTVSKAKGVEAYMRRRRQWYSRGVDLDECTLYHLRGFFRKAPVRWYGMVRIRIGGRVQC